jgi:YHS domain-containing protein
MDTRAFVLSVTLAGVIGVADIAAGQHEGHQTGAAATLSATQVAECRQAQPVITGLLNVALKRIDDARLTNSAAIMRDAADLVQAVLVDVRTQLAPCATMQVATAAQGERIMPAVPASPGSPSPATQQGNPAAAPPAAGHAVPPAAQRPASRAPAAAPTRTPSAPERPAPPSAADAHAAHATPAAPASRAPSAPTARPSAAPSKAPASAAHAGHATQAPSSPPATAQRTTVATSPTSLADLKCRNAVDPKTAPRMMYQGRMYYFCTAASRAEFAQDPTKFVTAPPQAAPAHAH